MEAYGYNWEAVADKVHPSVFWLRRQSLGADGSSAPVDAIRVSSLKLVEGILHCSFTMLTKTLPAINDELDDDRVHFLLDRLLIRGLLRKEFEGKADKIIFADPDNDYAEEFPFPTD